MRYHRKLSITKKRSREVQSVAQLVEYYFWKVEVTRSSRVTLIAQDILGKKNGSIPLKDSGEYLRG